MVELKCSNCKLIYKRLPSRVIKSKYCSKKCQGRSRVRTFKGSDYEYNKIHRWVRKNLGKPNNCEHCKITCVGIYHWANKSHEYKYELSDWIRLCPICHLKYDVIDRRMQTASILTYTQ